MDPFYLGIPSGPAIPPVQRTGLGRITRDQQHDETPQQQAREQAEPDESAEDAVDDDLEPIDTYDDHGRLHELGAAVHDLGDRDGGVPEAPGEVSLDLPAGSGMAAEAPDGRAEDGGGRRRSSDGGHIDISA